MAELKNIRIALSGIYDYSINELGSLNLSLSNAPDWVERKTIYKVYRPASVLAAACEKFKLLPLTHHHPQEEVNSVNFRDLVIGYTGENPFIDYIGDKDEVGIRSNVLLYDDEAQNAYARGEVQLSPGYKALFEWQKGRSPHGDEYDIVMKEINAVNHLALLPSGRGGDDARVLDAKPEHVTIFDMVRLTHDKEDANGAQHSDDNGQFVGNGNNGSKKARKGKLKVLNKEEIKDFIRKHKNSKENERVCLGEVKPEAKTRIKEATGLDTERVILDSDSIRHTFQKPAHNLEIDDLDDMYDVVNTTHDISLSSDTTKRGTPVIIFRKEESNGVYLLMEFRAGKHELELQTAYRQQNRRRHDETSPQANVRNGAVPSDNITQDFKNRKTIFEIVQGTVFDRYGA